MFAFVGVTGRPGLDTDMMSASIATKTFRSTFRTNAHSCVCFFGYSPSKPCKPA